MSKNYGMRGYYYRFPNSEFDAVGYVDESATPEMFRQVLKEKNITETKLHGCHIYLKNNYPVKDRVILIGDAGGFANRVTCEGIKAAFETARNATDAIKSGRPFREVNAAIFEKMKKEEHIAQLFYKPFSVRFIDWLSRYPRIIKWCFDRALRPT